MNPGLVCTIQTDHITPTQCMLAVKTTYASYAYKTARLHPQSRRRPWGQPASCHVHPLREAAAFFELYLRDFGITSAPAADTIFLLFVPILPVFVFLDSFLFVCCRHLEERLAWHLTSLCVCWTMGDGRVSVADITEIVDLRWGKKSTGGERMDGRITPLY